MGVSNFVLSAMVCLTIAVHESRQEPILERIKRYAYEENCLKDCNYCRSYTSYESALCGRRIGYEKYNPYKTFPSDCHLRCHNRCNDRNRYDYHYGGVCRREHEYPDHDHYDHDHDHGHDHSHDHSHDHGHDHSHYVANQDSRDVHAVIPTCTEAQKCLCSTACEPVCARSPDNPPVYVIFDNLCRLTCTNKCFEDDDHYVRAEPHMCKNGMRDYTCKYGQYYG